MILSGTWSGEGVFNMEQNDPDPFMEALNKYGLPWNCIELTREQAESLTVVK
jgi:saccharopine dehydrogenase (NAD+, L-lysine-forming)